MASPIIKIKRGTLKPGTYSVTNIPGQPTVQTGLTAGEMGVLIDPTNQDRKSTRLNSSHRT